MGAGDYLEALRGLTEQMGLSRNVTFTGIKRGKEKTELLQRASLLLYTSPKEGWGLSVVEANTCGTPVVASESPGLRESVVDGKTGFLVPHGDVQALAQRIDEMLSDPLLYRRMRDEAIVWGRRFTWERSVQETLELIARARVEFGRRA